MAGNLRDCEPTMPVCICPECEKPHKIPAKNLGLKGRCTQCRAIFELIEQQPAPAAPPPPPVVVPPVPDAGPDDFDTFSLRLPDPPAAAAPEPISEEVSSDDEFDWSEEIEEDRDETHQQRVGKTGGRVAVEPLPRRIAFEIIARWIWFIAVFELVCSAACIVLGLMAIAGQSRAWPVLIGSGVSGLVSGVIILGMSEALSMARAVEQRLYEISKNVSR